MKKIYILNWEPLKMKIMNSRKFKMLFAHFTLPERNKKQFKICRNMEI